MRELLFALAFGATLLLGSPPVDASGRADMDLGMKVKVRVGDSTITVCRCPTNYGDCFCTHDGMVDEREVGR
ncbi:MAG: hypothetical protein GXO29_05730 [Thermotogae bacterium]|nr:hypothetical protein [Thermotogota bacterium]